MKIGDRVTVTQGGQVIESHTTYTDKEKSCGWARVSDKVVHHGHVLGYHSGVFSDYWVVGLDNGNIIRVEA